MSVDHCSTNISMAKQLADGMDIVDGFKWVIGKLRPKRYGDSLHSCELPLVYVCTGGGTCKSGTTFQVGSHATTAIGQRA